ncbi:MAG: ATP-binding protein [Lachnospiraceae bacterium]|nr:ATP-binding protein [Lachnospiraceae bacterium]
MDNKKMIPVGVEDFKEIREDDYYYVDKTVMIRDLLHSYGKVNLFTRPRRFGKSLNMSMLKCFFEIGTDPLLFDGLQIAEEKELCEEYMGQYPVVSVSLKGVEGTDYESARAMAVEVLIEETRRLCFLKDSDCLSENDKSLYARLLDRNMDESTLISGLRNMTELLRKHYGKKVILLIDEYDVPLSAAHRNGYYDNMLNLVRLMFHQALKTNSSLFFAVLTGCLRVSRESIFTGLNNPKIFSITKVRFDEYFGFTDLEVRDMLEYYELTDHYDAVKEWYNGYQFGKVKVYNPWDIVNYLDELTADPNTPPTDFWSNTSGNYLVHKFIEEYGGGQTQAEIESLLAGETVVKKIREDLTYKTMYSNLENIWSALFMTGYLTMRGRLSGDTYELAIPNREVEHLFSDQIMELFQERVAKDGESRRKLCDALADGDANTVQELFEDYLDSTISLRDTFVHRERKENFYLGILLGLIAYRDGWRSKSNQEAGDGFADIRVEIRRKDIGIIIEMKYAEDAKFDEALQEAFDQIVRENYVHELKKEDFHTIYKYAIACYKKQCRVRCEKEE